MHKKKLLIVNKSFELGGIQMALANMLEELHEEYDVDLAIFNQNGPLKERVPAGVHLLALHPLVQTLGMSGADAKSHGTLVQRAFKLLSSVWARVFGNTLPVKFALAFQKSLGHYDAVISYHQETQANTMVTGFGAFALTKCTAACTVAWVHADFLATGLNTKTNQKTYEKFDKIVSVSRTTMEHFVKAYPSLAPKCDYCYNCVPTQTILEKADEPCADMTVGEGEVVLFSACRLVEEKGLLPAMQNLLPLWQNNAKLKWYIAGEGPERTAIEAFVHEHGLQNNVILLGFKQNPYPYMKKADYLFLPSLHETFSMVVSEAHVLGTPVIASDIPVMREVLGEGDAAIENGAFAACGALRTKPTKRSAAVEISVWKEHFDRLLGR